MNEDEKQQQRFTSELISLKVPDIDTVAEIAHTNHSEKEKEDERKVADDNIDQQTAIKLFTPGFVVNVLPRTWIGYRILQFPNF